MRIGIDARLLAYQRGGISIYTHRLIEALGEIASEQDEFTLLQSRKDSSPLIVKPAFQTHTLFTPPHHPWEQWTLPLELMGQPLDVLHSPDFIPPLRRRFPAVITVHDLSFRLFPETKTAESLRYYNQIDRAVREVQGIIAVSETTRQDIVRMLGVSPERVDVIYHGVDRFYREVENPQAMRDFCQAKGLPETFLLAVGTLEPRKNLSCLFQALSCAGNKLPREQHKLVVAGARGWRYEETERLFASLGLEEQTIFYGPATEEELVLLYNAAWALVFPSLYEGFGLPPLEAMACGTPVVASSAPALLEVLGEAALYFDPQDPEALAGHLVRLAEDTALRDRLRQAGLERAKGFRWHDTARRTLAVYRRAAAS